MELFFFGLNVLLIMSVWHFILRPTILDHCRDRLFDMRDELRTTFIERKWDMASPVYRRLRDLLNGHLRFTEQMSLMRMSYVKTSVEKDKELLSYVQARNAKHFSSSDVEQQKFIKELRKRSLEATMDYAICSSGILVMLMVVMLPFVCVFKLCEVLNRHVSNTTSAWIHRAKHLGGYVTFGMMVTRAMLAKVLMQPDFVENYSVERGMAA